MPDISHSATSPLIRDWVRHVIRLLDSDQRRSADTHPYQLNIPSLETTGIDIYLKSAPISGVF